MQLKRITVCVALAFVPHAYAAETAALPEVTVSAEKIQSLPASSNSGLDKKSLLRLRTHSSDTARLLENQPGVSLYGAGGLSSLPSIHGLADDRVRVKVDGMDLISACANHMNPPLSYIDPANVGSVKVFAGITPVSAGGDSIAGTVQVDSAIPEFAREGVLLKGQAGTFYRSNNAAQGVNLSATVAGESLYARYTGSTVKAKNYTAGANFHVAGKSPTAVLPAPLVAPYLAANEVGASQYQSDNHAFAFGLRHENHLLDLKLGLQKMPYQGFPNVRMDLLNNDSQQINLNYTGNHAWGKLQARVYDEHTRHYMNFLPEKQQSLLGMPMDTEGKNTGMLLKGDVLLSERDTLRIGLESQRYRLNDWWSPVSPLNTMMGGGTFLNINGGQRDRLAIFGEWEARWNQQWESQLGFRGETVKMNTGAVKGYNAMMYTPASYAAFNAANRQITDNNLDMTALARYTPDERKTFEFGLAQKTRSPNLYERFAWSVNNNMAMNMNTWFGDGNGYVGNLALKPEVARTLSGAFSWHDEHGFEVKAAPYYTYVQNYIDAVACTATATHGACPVRTDGYANLSFANQNARLYGADLSARVPMMGNLAFTGMLNYVNGKNLTTGGNLYNIMPLNVKLAVEQHTGNWTNIIEARLVDAKTNVEAVRREIRTGGYGLLNLYSSYEWKQLRFDVGIENALNKFYGNPMGGSYIGYRPLPLTTHGQAVPGMGRSINAGVTVKF